MKIPVYNIKGEKVKDIELPKEVFEVELNADLVHQVAVSQSSNRRVVRAHTKDRSEVSGGGRKPWKQKGTGRARAGSIRSPIWKGGGVTFGPTNDRNFKKKINTKMKRKALLMVLSEKAKNNFLILLEDLKLEKPKTKDMAGILQKLPSAKGKGLIVLPVMEKNTILASRNVKDVKTIQAKDLNVFDMLSSQYLIMPTASIETIQKTFV